MDFMYSASKFLGAFFILCTIYYSILNYIIGTREEYGYEFNIDNIWLMGILTLFMQVVFFGGLIIYLTVNREWSSIEYGLAFGGGFSFFLTFFVAMDIQNSGGLRFLLSVLAPSVIFLYFIWPIIKWAISNPMIAIGGAIAIFLMLVFMTKGNDNDDDYSVLFIKKKKR